MRSKSATPDRRTGVDAIHPGYGFVSENPDLLTDTATSGFDRAVYVLKIGDAIYVLHCFQKKSTHGISTPKPDMDLIRDRMKAAQEHAQGHGAKK